MRKSVAQNDAGDAQWLSFYSWRSNARRYGPSGRPKLPGCVYRLTAEGEDGVYGCRVHTTDTLQSQLSGREAVPIQSLGFASGA
jgi:hypothetical protein